MVMQFGKDHGAKSISDYGAGKCVLKHELNRLGWSDFQYYPYDPVFPEYGEPQPADLVCCIDVLEHVEPEYLESVLEDLQRIIVGVGLFTIHTGPAIKYLPNGQNAHLIQKPAKWWVPKLRNYFMIFQEITDENGFVVVVDPLSKL